MFTSRSIKKERVSIRLNQVLFVIFTIFLVSIVFSLRAVSSISIGLILLTGLIRHRTAKQPLSASNGVFLLLAGCSTLFILQCFALLYTSNLSEGLKLLQRSSGLVFIPFALFTSRSFLRPAAFQKLIFYFAIILSVAAVYCLAASSIRYLSGAPSSIFFYHDLVKSLSQHAIQFSILVFTALIFLLEDTKGKHSTSMNFPLKPMIAFLSVFLMLLSSKLIISFYIFYLTRFFLKKSFTAALILVGAASLIVLTPNPVGNRFRSMLTGNYMLFTQKKFHSGIYFNGLQFRLLEWRFTGEILNEQHAWLQGLTAGDAQSFLDKKYAETNMYTGVPGTENRGFLGYHTHNQFLQVTLENGLPGLLIFLFICFSLIRLAKIRKELRWLVVLLLVYCFTDAPLATQYGLIIFTFFPVFIFLAHTTSDKQIELSQKAMAIQKELFEIDPVKQPD